MLYSNKDYGCEWDYDWRNKRFQREDNTKFAVNLVVYAMTRADRQRPDRGARIVVRAAPRPVVLAGGHAARSAPTWHRPTPWPKPFPENTN